MKIPEIKSLYYITHINNLPSILDRGILSHSQVEETNVDFTPIYDNQIVNKRQEKYTPDNSSLWQYANLYFQPRNPMMYRVIKEKGYKNLAVVAIKPSVMDSPKAMITDGNAANDPTKFYPVKDGVKILRQQWSIIKSEWWNQDDGSKRKIMAECLIPNYIKPEYIQSIFVAEYQVKQRVEDIIATRNFAVIAEPNIFFQPNKATRIGSNISLIDGDMFFSNMQTLTISVNLQGVMGKGLASRAKYQFPDVYVEYQDACRKKQITESKPYLYRREGSLDSELADTTEPMLSSNAVKWFLLFATKRSWRDSSRPEDIKAGLEWIRNNYKDYGIKSLAMPALGCGLGSLEWKDVGKMMCSILHDIDIDVAIYLPRESEIDPMYLEAKYLLD
jgi:O-acetyl-ADP-ribose deacetylase (regulator of RNase III)